MSNPCSPSPPPLPPWRPKMNASFMRESPARNRKKILKGRNSTSSHNSQTITSSLISAPALTSRGLDCERSSRGLVKEVVVAHRDRLCRFALDLIFHLNSTRLVVLSNDNSTDEWELSQDILAINTVFICRLQGKRSARYRRERKQQTTRRAKRTKKADLTRSQKVRMYPNSSQKNLLRQRMGCARLVYNMVVGNYHRRHKKTKHFFFRSLLRLKIRSTKEWAFMDKVPYEVLDHAITNAI